MAEIPGQRGTGTKEMPGMTGAYVTEDRHQRGLTRMQEVLGEHRDTVLDSLSDVAPDLARFIVDFAYGEVHSRPGLDNRQRSLVAVSVRSGIGG